MAQISQHKNFTNDKIHFYDKTRKMMLQFDSIKSNKNDDSYPKLAGIKINYY